MSNPLTHMTAVDTATERKPRALADQERRRLVYAFRPRLNTAVKPSRCRRTNEKADGCGARRGSHSTISPQLLRVKLPHDAQMFNVLDGLLYILNHDAEVSGIPKHDERGRTVCIPGFRHTFGMHLRKACVPVRTAQAAMRTPSPPLTMDIYTDPALLDVAEAMNLLPMLPLDYEPNTERTKATGMAPASLVPTTGNHSTGGKH